MKRNVVYQLARTPISLICGSVSYAQLFKLGATCGYMGVKNFLILHKNLNGSELKAANTVILLKEFLELRATTSPNRIMSITKINQWS